MLEKTKIWRSQYRNEIVEMLRNNVSSYKISEWLKNRGEVITQGTINNFRKQLLTQTTEEKTYFEEHFKELDELIDAIREHSKLVKLQKDRISQSMEDKRTGPETRLNIQLYNELLKDHIKIKQLLGIISTPISSQTIVTKDQKTLVIQKLDETRKKIIENRAKEIAVTRKKKLKSVE